jgi:predicted double-glycine peptidase
MDILQRRRGWVVGIAFGLTVILAHCWNAPGAMAEETTQLDCGANALFILLRLQGCPVTLDRLDSALPPRNPEGYSMAELAMAAGSLGVSLEGVRFAKGDKALNSPAIALLKDAKGGHFVVLRPLGTTGTMVQVIDPPHVSWITDYDRLLASKPWTDRILVPSNPWFVRNAAPLMASAAGLLLFFAAFIHRSRSARVKDHEESLCADPVPPKSHP